MVKPSKNGRDEPSADMDPMSWRERLVDGLYLLPTIIVLIAAAVLCYLMYRDWR